jgi:hypothetical protein
MTDDTTVAWLCPKDGTEMGPIGRRSGAWRCPVCKGVFIDVEAMRRGRGDGPPVAPKVFLNIAIAITALVIARRVVRRRSGDDSGRGRGD